MAERVFAIAHYADQTVLYLLLALLVVSVYLIVERYFFLSKRTRMSKDTLKELEAALSNRDYSVVETLATRNGTSEGNLALLALDHQRKFGDEGLSEVFSTWIHIEKPKLERSLGFLATVGSNAPYIGLFGTVLGIMKSFHDLSQSADAGQNTVMAGISAALIATAAGLLVAIPAVLAYNYFQKQVKVIISNFESVRDLSVAYAKQKGWSNGR